MKKKMLGCLLSAFSLAMLVGCSGKEQALSNEEATTETTQTQAEESVVETTQTQAEESVVETTQTQVEESVVETESTAETNITILVQSSEDEVVSYEVTTEAEYLLDAMKETDGLTFEGSDTDYGFSIDTINGKTANYETDGSYWAIYINGDYAQFYADQQPISDGDEISFQYEIYQ